MFMYAERLTWRANSTLRRAIMLSSIRAAVADRHMHIAWLVAKEQLSVGSARGRTSLRGALSAGPSWSSRAITCLQALVFVSFSQEE